MKKVVRSLCLFARQPGEIVTTRRLGEAAKALLERGYVLQTTRVCSPASSVEALESAAPDPEVMLSLGTVPFEETAAVLPGFLASNRVSFNVDLTGQAIGEQHIELLSRIISENPSGAFRFAFVFNHVAGSPFFPSARYGGDGFSIGLQSTDLAAGCGTLAEWFGRMREVWCELEQVFGGAPDFLGIDSSIAPLFEGDSSLIHFLGRLGIPLSRAVTSDVFLRMTSFIASENPRPVGLCGLMLPCLEDFELAREYDQGAFPIERNVFASLHSGLGVDTYPVAVDEDPRRIAEVLRLVQGLAAKYRKPLSVRLVSDGKARIAERTDFQNQYLKDVVVRPL